MMAMPRISGFVSSRSIFSVFPFLANTWRNVYLGIKYLNFMTIKSKVIRLVCSIMCYRDCGATECVALLFDY